jgi:hypothetical protein
MLGPRDAVDGEAVVAGLIEATDEMEANGLPNWYMPDRRCGIGLGQRVVAALRIKKPVRAVRSGS